MQLPGQSAGGKVIGRVIESAAIARLLDTPATVPAALVVGGEAGIGKTTLFRAGLAKAESAGLRVFTASPAAGERELPYAALGDLLADTRSATFDSLAPAQRAAIRVALGRGEPGGVEQHALLRGLLELLRLEGADGRLVVAVDDAQWLDRPTETALAFALRRLGPVPVRVLIAVRTEPGAPLVVPLGLADWSPLQTVVVGAMAATDIGALVRGQLGRELSRPLLEELAVRSSGNPMLALELARQATVSASTLSVALAARLKALDAGTRAVLELASAALRPSAGLLLAAGVSPAQLQAAIDQGLIGLTGDRLSLAHPLLGEVAYAQLQPLLRRQHHARLARAATDPVEQGHHAAYSAVAPDDELARVLDLAADAVSGRGDHAGAARFLLRAAELSDERAGVEVGRRRSLAARELWLAGDVDAAGRLCRELIGGLPPGPTRAWVRHTLVECSLGAGMSYADSLVEIALAIDDAGDDDAVKANLHVAVTETMLGMGDVVDAIAQARLAIGAADRAASRAVATDALALLGFAESMLGLGVTDAAREAYARWDSTMGWAVSPRMLLACAYIPALAFGQAEQLLQEEIAMAEERGLEAVEAIARAHLAEAQLRAGRWPDALANASLATEHARQAAMGQIINGTAYSLGMAEALTGGHEKARALAGAALADAEATGDFWFTISHRAVLALVALAEGQPQLAVDLAEPAWRSMLEHRLGDLSLFPIAPVLGEALVAVGRVPDALGVVDALLASPVGALPWCRAIAGRCAALAASARRDQSGARNAIDDALHAQAQLPEPFEQARTLEVVGRVERSFRNWGAARSALTEALKRFDALGAAVWTRRCAAELDRLPGRRPADRTVLSGREADVAELAAAGLTNKEIAARLHLSVTSVEANLSAVYAKLGLRSRTELAGRPEYRRGRSGQG